jgi:Domain of unknown function (DUF1707)
MDRFTRMLAGLLGRSAGLLPAARRDWVEAVLAEAGEVRAGARRVAWLGGGLWLLAREVVMGRVIRVLAFAVAAVGMVWIGWPGASSNSATPLNRVYAVGTVVLLAVLPVVVHRYFGPVRSGWAPRTARVGGYAMVLALIAAKTVKDRRGSKLGAYFPVIPPVWALQIVLLLVIAAYVAGLLILTSQQRVRLARWILPTAIGFGAVTAGVLYPLAPLGVHVDPNGPSLKWWGLAALALPLATGFLAARLSARDTRPTALGPTGQGALAASCATATAALLLAVLTSVTIALFPHQVPLQGTPAAGGGGTGYIGGGGCETCDPNREVIPPGLRHEYWVELSVGQAGETPLAALLIAPFLGAWLGVLGGGLARRSPGISRGGGTHALSPPQPLGRLMASDANREQVIGVLTAAFAQGRLTKQELDLRAGQTFAARTSAELAALTADLPAELTRTQPARKPARARPRQPADKAVVWAAFGLITPAALLAATIAVPTPTPTDNQPIGKILFLVIVIYFIAWLAAGAQMLGTWHQQRSRPGAGRDLMEPGSPAVDE